MPATFLFRVVLRRAARLRGTRKMASRTRRGHPRHHPPLPTRDSGPRDGFRDSGRRRPADRLHAPARGRAAATGPDRRGSARTSADAPEHVGATGLRLDHPMGGGCCGRGSRDRGTGRIPSLHHPAAANRIRHDRRRLRRHRGRTSPLHSRLARLVRAHPARRGCRVGPRPDGGVVA